jgi:uncharacterized protein YhaN
MTMLETQRYKLNTSYKKWLTGKIALQILSEVRNGYEKKRQPAVIKSSSVYFSKITDEKYQRIHVSQNRKEVAVFDTMEMAKGIDQLSRGTREQLLISLRLGFIEEYEKQTQPLPVIMDEVLVNFDPNRARNTAEILQNFASERQVLLFTCHPDTKNLFSASKINLIKI